MRVAEVVHDHSLRAVGAGGLVSRGGKTQYRRVSEVQKVDRGRTGTWRGEVLLNEPGSRHQSVARPNFDTPNILTSIGDNEISAGSQRQTIWSAEIADLGCGVLAIGERLHHNLAHLGIRNIDIAVVIHCDADRIPPAAADLAYRVAAVALQCLLGYRTVASIRNEDVAEAIHCETAGAIKVLIVDRRGHIDAVAQCLLDHESHSIIRNIDVACAIHGDTRGFAPVRDVVDDAGGVTPVWLQRLHHHVCMVRIGHIDIARAIHGHARGITPRTTIDARRRKVGRGIAHHTVGLRVSLLHHERVLWICDVDVVGAIHSDALGSKPSRADGALAAGQQGDVLTHYVCS